MTDGRAGAGAAVTERRADVAGLPLFWYEAEAPGEPAGAPVIYLHGVPTNADDWLPFLGRSGGIAPDLPGFGRSGKPAAFDYSIAGYAVFLESLVDAAGLDRFSLVVHDWGSVGLALAQLLPERIERLVVMNAVPLLPGFRWPRVARWWERRVVGELVMGFTTRWGLRQSVRKATVDAGAPVELADRAWRHFDHGTQRAILKLYRSSPPGALARAGEGLGAVACPSLVLWGVEDPWIPASFARAYADALGGTPRLELVDGAGHWPWLDRPELVDSVTRFLRGEPGA